MKKYLFLGLMMFSLGFEAQNIRIEGKILPNEIRSKRKPNTYRTPPAQGSYYFGNSYAEMWLRVLEQGRFRVEIGDQAIENATGYYRFFDLPEGRQILSIYENRFLIYRAAIDLRANSRLMLDFDGYSLYLYNEERLNNGYDEFFPNLPQNRDYLQGMSNAEFEKFFKIYSSEPFDDDKLQIFYIKLKSSFFTSGQIVRMMNALYSDKKQIELAKVAYDRCVDKENYYEVVNSLKFPSSKREVKEFLLKKGEIF